MSFQAQTDHIMKNGDGNDDLDIEIRKYEFDSTPTYFADKSDSCSLSASKD